MPDQDTELERLRAENERHREWAEKMTRLVGAASAAWHALGAERPVIVDVRDALRLALEEVGVDVRKG